MVEKITAYKTSDGTIYESEQEASSCQGYLELINLVDRTDRLYGNQEGSRVLGVDFAIYITKHKKLIMKYLEATCLPMRAS